MCQFLNTTRVPFLCSLTSNKVRQGGTLHVVPQGSRLSEAVPSVIQLVTTTGKGSPGEPTLFYVL